MYVDVDIFFVIFSVLSWLQSNFERHTTYEKWTPEILKFLPIVSGMFFFCIQCINVVLVCILTSAPICTSFAQFSEPVRKLAFFTGSQNL